MGWVHYWPWLVGAVAVMGAVALAFRSRVARLVRLGKAAATDPRLPRSVRWLFGVGIAVKALPVPDFGLDEIALGLGIVLLATKYRSTWRLIREETR